ncbi:MAG: hypothetical protein WD066_14230 [Planctomycetaceae bacterium]
MHALLENLIQLFEALWAVFVSLGAVILPWLPLVAWAAFWLLAVDWVRLREVMLKGGWIPVLLIGLAAILVWGTVAPPAGGLHEILGLRLSNFVGKTVYVAALFSIAFLCGAVQLSGAVDCCRTTDEPEPVEPAHPPSHH